MFDNSGPNTRGSTQKKTFSKCSKMAILGRDHAKKVSDIFSNLIINSTNCTVNWQHQQKNTPIA